MRVLLTGGAGYIGAHTSVALAAAGHDVAIVDDLSAVSAVAVDRVSELAGTDIPLLAVDVRDEAAVTEFIGGIGGVDAIIHLAGVKSVARSVADPVAYYDINIGTAIASLRIAAACGIRTLVFSSSATVYPSDGEMPLTEDGGVAFDQVNPYGKTKRIVEELLRDASAADPGLQVVVLRYFNPVGAHPSGRIGEDPLGEPQNLMPLVARAASGVLPRLAIYGDDYPTPDGTTLRDFIHVMDLAEAHVAAVERAPAGFSVFNIGTGVPVSVLELVGAFERASGREVPRAIVGRRPGDLPVSYADPGKAARELGWRARRTVEEACADYWRWQELNPRGYRG